MLCRVLFNHNVYNMTLIRENFRGGFAQCLRLELPQLYPRCRLFGPVEENDAVAAPGCFSLGCDRTYRVENFFVWAIVAHDDLKLANSTPNLTHTLDPGMRLGSASCLMNVLPFAFATFGVHVREQAAVALQKCARGAAVRVPYWGQLSGLCDGDGNPVYL